MKNRFYVYATQNESVTLPESITSENFEIKHISIPQTWYSIISGYNNEILFNEGGPNLTATIVSGFYETTAEICGAIKVALEAAGALTYTVTYSNITKLFTIAASANYRLMFASQTNPNILDVIGFLEADYAVNTSFTATYAGRLVPFDDLYLHIKEFRDINNFITNIDKRITYLVPITGVPAMISRFGENSQYNDTINTEKTRLDKVTLQVYHPTRDGHSRVLDLHGGKISIVIESSYLI